MPVDLSAYRSLYVKTALELIKRYGALKQDKSSIQELHRIAHSLKGQSLALGFKKVGTYLYLLERFFAYCMQHNDMIDSELYGTLPSEAVLTVYIEHIENTEQGADIEVQIEKWKSALLSLGVEVTIS